MKKKLRRRCVVVGSLAFILNLTGCASARFTEYRRSFRSSIPKEMMSGDCVFRGATNLSGNVFLRYELHDFAHWDKHSPNMTYLVPQSQGRLAVEKTSLPIRHEDLNAGFVFYSEGTQAYLQDVIKQMKLSQHPVYTSILLVCATQDGKGTRVSLLSKEDSKWL